jgi:hypothetical protein
MKKKLDSENSKERISEVMSALFNEMYELGYQDGYKKAINHVEEYLNEDSRNTDK